MKLTTDKNVYKRSSATNEGPADSYILSGQSVEIAEVVFGKPIDNNGVWYKAADNVFYWSGGFSTTDFVLPSPAKQYADLNDNERTTLILSAISKLSPVYVNQVEGYKGLAVGINNNNFKVPDLVFVVYVTSKVPLAGLTTPLPATISFCGFEIPVDVKEVGKPKVHSYNPPVPGTAYIDTVLPLCLGGSISLADSQYFGSRSLVVTKAGTDYVVTCFHVMGADLLSLNLPQTSYVKAAGSVDIIGNIPSQISYFQPPASQCIAPDKAILSEGYLTGAVDYCLVSLPISNTLQNSLPGQDNITTYYTFDEVPSLKGQTVQTFGAKSLQQSGQVTDTNSFPILFVNNNFPQFHYSQMITTEKISMPGDSGAPVVDMQNKLVGFIVGGDDSTNQSYIMPYYKIEQLTIKQ